jgi:hypothetical protein
MGVSPGLVILIEVAAESSPPETLEKTGWAAVPPLLPPQHWAYSRVSGPWTDTRQAMANAKRQEKDGRVMG